MSKSYRKIYEELHGPIPVDANGRTYEIHHVDGNHSNDNISNLKLVSIQEHYDIHYQQEDWGACQAIQMRMDKSPQEISEECSRLAKKAIQNGDRPWLSSEYARARELKKVENGTHSWMGEVGSAMSSERNLRRVKEGLNPFAGEQGSRLSKQVQRIRVENGTHPFAGEAGSRHSTELNKRLLAEGRHSSQNPAVLKNLSEKQLERSKLGINNFQLQVKNGEHPSTKAWNCVHCGKNGIGLGNYARWHGDNCKIKEH